VGHPAGRQLRVVVRRSSSEPLARVRDHERTTAGRTVLPGKVLELEVEHAISLGRKRPQPPTGVRLPSLGRDERFVIVTGSVGAVLRREPSPTSGRRSWRVTRVLPIGARS
jgi:hypothetical protein